MKVASSLHSQDPPFRLKVALYLDTRKKYVGVLGPDTKVVGKIREGKDTQRSGKGYPLDRPTRLLESPG